MEDNERLNSINSKIELAEQQNNLVKEQINETLKTQEKVTRYLEWYEYLNKILEDDYDTTLVKELESFAKMIVDSKIYKHDLILQL